MTTTAPRTRVGRAVLLAVVVLLLLLAGALAAWQFVAPDLYTRGKSATRAGVLFAQGKDAEACVAESVRRLDGLSLLGEAENKSFLAACLGRAPPGADLCVGVPMRDNRAASEQWARSVCGERAPNAIDACMRLMGALQRACLPR